ncbi:HET-domain-containing protein, partial [Dissoconium aciculare CBS 342.82]|uniref:HET-domain-containing protein n=1 Tax=Dissoconium aciculare CBS 342.82 TaxID=1314786 RepID=A0A6J3LYX6_9PEZI
MDLYSPIDGQLGEIRVLRIFPGSADDPIQCSLQLCSLVTEVKPYYRALSYAWGTEMSDIPISVDGHPRVITSNLYAALRSLRDEESEVALWVDALCINQQDLVEKMHQIGQMRTIYREARQVV